MKLLAFDLGAGSGRAMLGTLESGALRIEELHRFDNTPVQLPTGLYWDTLRLFHEIRRGLAAAGKEKIDGIGIDTWGVDFGLLSADGALVDNPRHYRDTRTNGIMDRVFAVVPRADIFETTGVQFMQLNTLYQWYSMKASPSTAVAKKLLFMPDLFNYWLTGVARAERTIASTSQFYDPRTGRFATELLGRLGLDASILPEIVDPGTRLGTLLDTDVPVYATGCHDTASAVAAVPAQGDDWCYISSGTWSLMGVEIDQPIINAQSLAENFTNEAGAGGKIRFLKNIPGLWLLEECRHAWAQAGHKFTYQQLMALAAKAEAGTAIVNVDGFLEPGRMPERIAEHCRSTAQSVPEEPGLTTRVILESLADRYRRVLAKLEALTGRKIRTIHIVGGGSQNRLLNQLAADATGRTVLAGPVEATAIGNAMIQAIGAGAVSGFDEARAIVRDSFQVERFEPA